MALSSKDFTNASSSKRVTYMSGVSWSAVGGWNFHKAPELTWDPPLGRANSSSRTPGAYCRQSSQRDLNHTLMFIHCQFVINTFAVSTLAHTPPLDSGYLVIILEISLCLTCLPSCHHTPSEAPDLRPAFPRHSASPGSSSPPSQHSMSLTAM
ncbi:uncharacterized protein LOC143412799 [Maylandia zebra]|uniref:uncharacterized protein LOC143412799 n=1 Tax=Maylandia zebra TaxID=106582 RepID=UPI00403C2427